MPRPQTKQEFIDIILVEHKKLLDVLDLLTDDQMTRGCQNKCVNELS